MRTLSASRTRGTGRTLRASSTRTGRARGTGGTRRTGGREHAPAGRRGVGLLVHAALQGDVAGPAESDDVVGVVGRGARPGAAEVDAGGTGCTRGTGGTGRTRAGGTSGTRSARCTLRAGGAGRALRTLYALRTLRTCGALRTLSASRTRGTGRTLRASSTRTGRARGTGGTRRTGGREHAPAGRRGVGLLVHAALQGDVAAVVVGDDIVGVVGRRPRPCPPIIDTGRTRGTRRTSGACTRRTRCTGRTRGAGGTRRPLRAGTACGTCRALCTLRTRGAWCALRARGTGRTLRAGGTRSSGAGGTGGARRTGGGEHAPAGRRGIRLLVHAALQGDVAGPAESDDVIRVVGRGAGPRTAEVDAGGAGRTRRTGGACAGGSGRALCTRGTGGTRCTIGAIRAIGSSRAGWPGDALWAGGAGRPLRARRPGRTRGTGGAGAAAGEAGGGANPATLRIDHRRAGDVDGEGIDGAQHVLGDEGIGDGVEAVAGLEFVVGVDGDAEIEIPGAPQHVLERDLAAELDGKQAVGEDDLVGFAPERLAGRGVEAGIELEGEGLQAVEGLVAGAVEDAAGFPYGEGDGGLRALTQPEAGTEDGGHGGAAQPEFRAGLVSGKGAALAHGETPSLTRV